MNRYACFYKASRRLFSVTALGLAVSLSFTPETYAQKHNTDSLYIGDNGVPGPAGPPNDDTVERFNAFNGQWLGTYITSKSDPIDDTGGAKGGFSGVRGLIFDPSGNLDLSNQNVEANFPGAILQYKDKGKIGEFLKAIISPTSPNAPFAPRGIVIWNHDVLFVADQQGDGPPDVIPPPGGRVLAFTRKGEFLKELWSF
jgi:hypothetical protein